MAETKAGGMIKVEVTKIPRNAAAQKTLLQLLRRDLSVVRKQRAQKVKRPSWQEWRRGGMQWHHQMKTEVPIKLAKGAAYTIRGSVDVMRRLESVQDCVKISAAK